MELKQLQRLLTQEESPTLEFKERWYAVDSPHQQTREAQKEEFIKDILALANGSVSTAGETAYLIIGPDDKERDADGQRILHHVAEPLPSIQMLLRWINNACDPALEQVILERVTLKGQDLFVFTIPFSPHVHETTKKLAGYTEHSVFLRVRDEIHIANARERKALSTIKQQHLEESEHVPPRFFGSFVGALAGGVLVYAVVQSNPLLGSPVVYGLAAAIVGGILGWVQGDAVRTVRQIHRGVRSKPILEQVRIWLLLGLATIALAVGIIYLLNRIGF